MISLLIGSIQLVCRTKCLKQIVLPRPVGVRGTLLDMLSSNFKVREQLVGASESMFLLLVGTNGGNTEGMVYDSKYSKYIVYCIFFWEGMLATAILQVK